MAKSTTENPRYYSGPKPSLRSMTATNGKTWKAGELAIIAAAGTVEPAVSGSTTIVGFFAEDQDTSTASLESVKVHRIESTETKFIGFVSANNADTTAQLTDIGEQKGVHVGSNLHSVNTSNDTDFCFYIHDLLWKVEPNKAASTDSPGQVIFSVLQGNLNADVG